MQEKSTNIFRQKLDTLTELPDGFSFDAVQSWNRMEEKISGKTAKKKRVLWFMVAASAIFLLLSTLYFFNQTKEEAITTIRPAATEKQNPSITTVDAHQERPVFVKNNQSTSLSQESIQLSKIKKDPVIVDPVKQEELKEEVITLQAPKSEEAKVETNKTEPVAIEVPVAVTPVKRKIIHINELGRESFLTEQKNLTVKEEKTSSEIIAEEAVTPAKPWYKKIKLSHRANNN